MIDETDVQTVEVTSIDGEHKQMELIAKMAAQLLSRHYANFPWIVGWMPGGALAIKLMGSDNRFGYTVDVPAAASISELERAIIWGGGEMLERLGLPRGEWTGEDYVGRKFDGQS